MPINPGPRSQGIPAERASQDPPSFDTAKSRDRQLRDHGKVVDGKRDGNSVRPKPTADNVNKTSGPGR